MEKNVKKIIIDYMKRVVKTKRGYEKKISDMEKQIDTMIENAKERNQNEQDAIDLMNKYKLKYNKERKDKLKLAMEYKQLTKEFKETVKENEDLKTGIETLSHAIEMKDSMISDLQEDNKKLQEMIDNVKNKR